MATSTRRLFSRSPLLLERSIVGQASSAGLLDRASRFASHVAARRERFLDGNLQPFFAQTRHLYTSVTCSKQLKDALREPNKLLVTQFSAAWCGPCRKAKPVIMKWGEQYREDSVSFLSIDIDELADVAEQYQVNSVPTFILVKNGKEVEKVVGADLERLKSAIEKHRPSD